MNKSILIIAGVVLGILFILLALLYWFTPANALPSFIPGFDVASTKIHFKHGLASLLLGLGSFIYTWFISGKKSAQ